MGTRYVARSPGYRFLSALFFLHARECRWYETFEILMKKLLPIASLLLTLISAPSSSQAWWGGPFGTGLATPDGAGAPYGTWQVAISGKNTSGVAIFGTGATSTVDSDENGPLLSSGHEGMGVVFVEGEVVICDVSGIADPMAKMVAGVINGSKSLGDELIFDASGTLVETIASQVTVQGFFNGDIKSGRSLLTLQASGILEVLIPNRHVVEDISIIPPVFIDGVEVAPAGYYVGYSLATDQFEVKIRVDGAMTSSLPPDLNIPTAATAP